VCSHTAKARQLVSGAATSGNWRDGSSSGEAVVRMPKSKRDRGPATMKDMALTKTEKKGRQIKNGLIQQIREAVDKHEAMYMFTFENLRSTHMKV
jgi:hypothetical protein